MSRPPREQRRAELARTAQHWGNWLRSALTERGMEIKMLVELGNRAGARFEKTAVSKWLAGDNAADPTNAVVIARILGRDPLEALRAAGHHTLADTLDTHPDPETVAYIAAAEDIPAPALLRAAGHDKDADYIESVTGPGGFTHDALEQAIVEARELTEGMTPEEVAAFEQGLLREIREWAQRDRETTTRRRTGNGRTNGAQSAS
jgi:hypothetical protein